MTSSSSTGWLAKLFSGNRVASGDILGAAVINGDVSGIVIQQIGSSRPPPPVPSLPWRDLQPVLGRAGEPEIFNLLTWRTRLVRTLIGRDADRDRLVAWACDDPRPIAVRLLGGAGGAGKSRLAAEVANSLRAQHWVTGFVDLGARAELPVASAGLLLIVDYPEEWREPVRALLHSLGRLEGCPAKLRLLLLSRQDLNWWFDDFAAAGASELCDTQESIVGPLEAHDLCRLVQSAAKTLAEHRGLPPPVLADAAIAAWHAGDPALHGLPLFATAAALHAVLDPGPTFDLAGPEIVAALVRRERRRLDQAAKNAAWPEAEAASRLHGLAALRSTLDEPALTHLARAAPELGLPPPERVMNALEQLGWLTEAVLPAPQPDLIAAELLRQTLGDRPRAAPNWLAATLASPDTIDVDRLGRLAHDMAILAGEDGNPLVDGLIDAVTRTPGLAIPWRVILDTAIPFRLAPLGIAIGQALLREADLDDRERSVILNNLSIRLRETGDETAALGAIEEAVAIRRRLAAADPARFEPDLATSLGNLSNCLSAAGDETAALGAIEAAVAIFRRLAAANPARLEPDLAKSLGNLSNRLSAAGDETAALGAIEAAVAIFRRLAAANPARFEPDLATSLNNLSVRLSAARDEAAALAATEAALAIRRRLATANPARFEPDLAQSLNNLSHDKSTAGDETAALAAIEAAVAIRRRLAAANPARFGRDLANSLSQQERLLARAKP